MQGSFWGVSIVRDLPLYVLCQFVVVPQFDVRSLCPQILLILSLRRLRAVHHPVHKVSVPLDGQKLKRARKDRDEWEALARRLEAERDSRERELSELQKVLADKTAEIEALTERLNAQPGAQPAPVEETQQEQAPADKAAALVETLAALDGITATVKGAQTAAPVVWLTGEADAHKEKIEAMGGKWSTKRGAWYFKIA